MRHYDIAETLHYVDPPYLHSTRAMRTTTAYRCELDDEGHRELLDVVLQLRGSVLVSGYDHPIYRAALSEWRLETKAVRASGGRGAVMRTEHLWISPSAGRQTLF